MFLFWFLFFFLLLLPDRTNKSHPLSSVTISHETRAVSQRKKGFKKAIDAEEGRRRREETTIQIRKTKKDVRLAKRRQMPGPSSAATPAGMAAASMLAAGGVAPGGYQVAVGMDAGAASMVGGANKLENLPQMVEGVMGDDAAVQTECTTQFRRLLSIEKNPPIQQVIDSGVVPRFVEFLQRDDSPALQFEAAWALTNVSTALFRLREWNLKSSSCIFCCTALYTVISLSLAMHAPLTTNSNRLRPVPPTIPRLSLKLVPSLSSSDC